MRSTDISIFDFCEFPSWIFLSSSPEKSFFREDYGKDFNYESTNLEEFEVTKFVPVAFTCGCRCQTKMSKFYITRVINVIGTAIYSVVSNLKEI